jgi:hypothetical protein
MSAKYVYGRYRSDGEDITYRYPAKHKDDLEDDGAYVIVEIKTSEGWKHVGGIVVIIGSDDCYVLAVNVLVI